MTMRDEYPWLADNLRTYQTTTQLNGQATINGMLASSFIAAQKPPIKNTTRPGGGPFNTRRLYRWCDVIARAKSHGARISQSLETRHALIEATQQLATIEARLAQARVEYEEVSRQTATAKFVNEAHMLLTGHTAFSKAEIVEAARVHRNNVCGVYFLVNDGDVVYVGQSVNVHARIAQHRTDPRKTFTHWAAISVRKEHLDFVESIYIHTFKPALNGCAPLPWARILSRQVAVPHPSRGKSGGTDEGARP